jgi:uncharacterized protein (DUF1697 family)
MTAYAILLRGVNVGGHGSLPMATLREVLTELGYDGVQTYLQSGNAVVRTSASATSVHDEVAKALAERVGRDIGVLVRSHTQLRKVVDSWPFSGNGAPTAKHVIFLEKAADAKPLRELDAGEFEPEQFSASGTHVYLSAPNGLGRSKLAPVVNRKLAKTVTTMRNWNTVTALTEMTA